MVSKRRSSKRTISALGLALVASLALGAVGVASASAATQHWYVGGTKLAEGTPTSVTMKGTTSFSLFFTYGGGVFEFKCTSQNSEGTIENPTGGSAGTDSKGPFKLSGCTRVRPLGSKGCQIQNGEVNISTSGVATEFESKSAVTFGPQEGSLFFSIGFEGSNCALPTLLVSGSLTGIANNATSSLEFTKTSSKIYWGGNEANPITLVGTSKLETTSGQTVTVAP